MSTPNKPEAAKNPNENGSCHPEKAIVVRGTMNTNHGRIPGSDIVWGMESRLQPVER
jgi:hypothetical protein